MELQQLVTTLTTLGDIDNGNDGLDNDSVDNVGDEERTVGERGVETRNEEHGVETLKHSDTQPPVNTIVQYCLKDNSITKAKIMSTQPKRVSKFRNWVNVHIVGEEKPSSVN